MIGTVAGMSAIPAMRGLTPTMSSRKNGRRKPSPSSMAPARIWLMFEARKLRWRKRRKSSIGARARSSMTTKAASAIAPTAIGIHARGAPKLASSTSDRPKMSAPVPSANVATPGKSRPGRSAPR
jgi:hypothetical protein